jgi:predicted transcriptional regulator
MAKNMTLRLSDEQAAELDAIARVENVPIAEEVRQALTDYIAAKRQDQQFQARLRASLERNQEILRRLATS